MCLTAAGAQSRCSTGAAHSGRRGGRHRQQHHGTTSNLSENCFIAFSLGMESWTRDVATAAGGTYSYDDAAFCLEGHKIKRRFAHLPLCPRSRLLLSAGESRIDDSSKKNRE
jgi:hypothetical protein